MILGSRCNLEHVAHCVMLKEKKKRMFMRPFKDFEEIIVMPLYNRISLIKKIRLYNSICPFYLSYVSKCSHKG